jgi:hypothetical protein
MEYFRQPGNRIQAGFALHAGRLLAQYCSLTATLRSHEKYEATLAVCVLQSLLTNCTELLSDMRASQKTFFNATITDVPHRWGLTRSFITCNTFPTDVTLEGVLIHVRNALSHPTVSDGARFPSTGYTTSRDTSGLVSAFRFTDSPWVKKGAVYWGATSKKEAKVRKTIEDFERQYALKGFLEVLHQPDGTFGIARDGEPFLPVFVIELPLPALIDLAKGLANYLAQPTIEQWDGQSIHELVA